MLFREELDPAWAARAIEIARHWDRTGASVDQPSGAATELLAVLSKSPMPAASKALALEYAAKNIRFNTISPAVVNRVSSAKNKIPRFWPKPEGICGMIAMPCLLPASSFS